MNVHKGRIANSFCKILSEYIGFIKYIKLFFSPPHKDINNIECSVHFPRGPCFRRKVLDKGLLIALKEELLLGRTANRIVLAQSGKQKERGGQKKEGT